MELREQIRNTIFSYIRREVDNPSIYLLGLTRMEHLERLRHREESVDDLWDILDILEQVNIITWQEFETTRSLLRRLDFSIH